MKYKIIRLCGNLTLIINWKYKNESEDFDLIKQKFKVEQTGFLDFEKQYFEMEGGEFCGNGLRAAGICLGMGNWKIKTNVYPYFVTIAVTKSNVKLIIPTDIFIRENNILKSDGISYAFSNEDYGFSDSPCEGIIQITKINNQIKILPKIWVKSINSIVTETACASGSIATAIYLQLNDCKIIQPSGGIYDIRIDREKVMLTSCWRVEDSEF